MRVPLVTRRFVVGRSCIVRYEKSGVLDICFFPMNNTTNFQDVCYSFRNLTFGYQKNDGLLWLFFKHISPDSNIWRLFWVSM